MNTERIILAGDVQNPSTEVLQKVKTLQHLLGGKALVITSDPSTPIDEPLTRFFELRKTYAAEGIKVLSKMAMVDDLQDLKKDGVAGMALLLGGTSEKHLEQLRAMAENGLLIANAHVITQLDMVHNQRFSNITLTINNGSGLYIERNGETVNMEPLGHVEKTFTNVTVNEKTIRLGNTLVPMDTSSPVEITTGVVEEIEPCLA